jgi:NTP pyrophosphatase (non-canonical NTP hydrolase)
MRKPQMTTFGAFKVMEEAGELTQALAKMGPFPDGVHPDGGPPLHVRVEDEAADVLAAICYYVETNGLDPQRIDARAQHKLALFRKWGLTALDGSVPAAARQTKEHG